MIKAAEFDFTKKEERAIEPLETKAAIERGAYCWIDIQGGSDEEARSMLELHQVNETRIAEILGPPREGRYEVFSDCLHFALTEARIVSGRVVTSHVDVLLKEGCLFTLRKDEAAFMTHMHRTYREDFYAFSKSPSFLLYEVGDHLADQYRQALRKIATEVESVQLTLFGEVSDDIFRHVAEITSDLLVFRKVVIAARDVVHQLATRKSPFITESAQPFIESIAARMERLGDDLISEREVVTETLNLYMGMVSHRTNKVVNRLTVISAIFLPLTFLCGLYGMNFAVMPELTWKYSYLVFWIVTFILAGSMVVYMKRKRWI